MGFNSRLVALLCALAITASTLVRVGHAQEPSPSPTPATQAVNRVDLHQALLDLTNPFTVMCVAAHPDDEDGTTLTVLRRKHGVHTVSLFSTYGEGGQNAVGPELYEQLGVIRAQETRKASVIQGSEPYFLGMKDFGFSKSAEEAFKVWGHDESLRRMVLKIRELRPDVIITNHDTARGHGHHQATGQLIIEAFDAAADPKRFPEQLTQLRPWQPQRLFVRLFSSSSNDQKTEPGPERVVAIDPNEVDPVRGTAFAAQALQALQQHATQGPWPKSMEDLLRSRRAEAGKLPLIRYQLVREAAGARARATAEDGAPSFLGGLTLPESLTQRITLAKIDGKALTELMDRPGDVLDALLKQHVPSFSSVPEGEDSYRVRLFEARRAKAIALAAGVSLTISASDSVLVPGVKTTFTANLANAGERPVKINKLSINSWGEESRLNTAEQLLPDSETTAAVEKTIPLTAAVTVPKEDHLSDGTLMGFLSAAQAELEIEGGRFVVNAQTNPDIAPAVEIERIAPSPCVRTLETPGNCKVFAVKLTNHLGTPFRGVIKVAEINRKRTGYAFTRQLVLAPNESRDEMVRDDTVPRRKPTRAALRNSTSVTMSIRQVDSEKSITERSVPLVYSDAGVAPDLRVGYVPSFDDTLQRSLAALGVEAKALAVSDVQTGDLSIYNVVIIDNRGYEAHPDLIAANSRLLDFANEGGTLIVFYHKDNEWNPDPKKNRPQLAPYPIVLGGERVTYETAPIAFTSARHKLLNYPNKIGQGDFQNWIQERGLYYPKEWDPRYSTLFSTHDPGEKPLTGGLLAAKYGKGNYIYTSMVWYRQLRAGVPGAYRMFANMISYGR
ncbi:MAG TPA: PIG-L family deacetylase [Pyrinomonadaceae bacterium]|nr:PIG-L family deacetylase [Pyrinomonadaceae bacterium]